MPITYDTYIIFLFLLILFCPFSVPCGLYFMFASACFPRFLLCFLASFPRALRSKGGQGAQGEEARKTNVCEHTHPYFYIHTHAHTHTHTHTRTHTHKTGGQYHQYAPGQGPGWTGARRGGWPAGSGERGLAFYLTHHSQLGLAITVCIHRI